MRVLLLVHRVPYPPDKGDKIRSFRIMEALCEHHEVHLLTHADDTADLAFVGELEKRCRSVHVVPISAVQSKGRMAAALFRGEALSVAHFVDRRTTVLVENLITGIDPELIVVYSSQPVRYLPAKLNVPVIVDLVDVDSEKWRAYADDSFGPMRWLYRREARVVRELEKEIVRRGYRVVVVSEREADAFRAAVAQVDVSVIPNGVDAPRSVAPGASRDENLILFVGAMDYTANVEAVRRAAMEVLPLIRTRRPSARFRIVGRNPTRAVRALAELPGVEVTGAVASVAPHLEAAAVSLVPLRVSRGIPNKVLEAFAHGVPVVSTGDVARAVSATDGEHLLVAERDEDLAAATVRLLEDAPLRDRIGTAARTFVTGHYRWDRMVSAFQALASETATQEVVG